MKILLLALLFCTILTSNAQTVEEFNYLTKGLRIQEESGLDMKKGYSFENINSSNAPGNFIFKFKYLINSENKKVAVSITAENKVTKLKYYLAIPLQNNNSELFNSQFQSYYNTIGTWGKDMLAAYSLALSTTFYYMNANI